MKIFLEKSEESKELHITDDELELVHNPDTGYWEESEDVEMYDEEEEEKDRIATSSYWELHPQFKTVRIEKLRKEIKSKKCGNTPGYIALVSHYIGQSYHIPQTKANSSSNYSYDVGTLYRFERGAENAAKNCLKINKKYYSSDSVADYQIENVMVRNIEGKVEVIPIR